MLNKGGGGIGVRNLKLQNENLLMKWLWRCTKERTLWRNIIVTEFGGLNPWCSNFVSDPYGMAVWRTIRNFWPLVETNLSFKIGIETRIFFGMMELINHHFQICGNTEAGVSKCWTTQRWDISFRRMLNDWEADRVAS